MPEERIRSLRYRRAVFNNPKKGQTMESLEQYLLHAHRKFKTVDQRRIRYDGGYTLEIRQSRSRRGVGLLLHLAAYTHEEPTNVVPLVVGVDSAPIGVVPPPRNADFMDGDLMALVAGNNAIICSNGLHEAKLAQYCMGIFMAAELPPAAALFELAPVADASKVQLIQDQGVREIKLKTVMYEASTNRAHRQSLRRKLGGNIREEILALFGADLDAADIDEKSALSAEVVIKFDRRKGGEIEGRALESLAKQVVAEEDEGFKIKTMDGTVVGASSISVQKAVKLRVLAKTVAYESAFQELEVFFHELGNNGMLEH